MKPTHQGSTAHSRRLWFGALLALSASLTWIDAQSQQRSELEGVAIFAPHIAVEQEPQADLHGTTELMMAARHADIDSARRLIETGADVNEADNSGDTALLWAVNSGAVEVVDFLISQGADVGAKSIRGATPLIMAISRNREAIAVALINAGADPNGRVSPNRNFLETAAESGVTDVVDALIASGVDLSTHGPSALSYAISNRNKGSAILLLDAGVDVNAPATLSKTTILYAAAKSGDIDMIRLLISRGADANQPNGYKSPLYQAVTGGHTTMTELLLDHGAVANLYYVEMALRWRKPGTAAALLDRLDVDAMDRADMRDLLETADAFGLEDVVQRLLAASSAPRVHNESVKLLFRQTEDTGCNLLVWNPRTNEQRPIYEEEGDCSAKFFVADGPSALFALQNNEIRAISVDSPFEDKFVGYPVDVINGQMQKLSANFKKRYEYARDRDASDAKPAAIGYLEDGELGLTTYTSGPAGGIYANLFGLFNGEWRFVAKQFCDPRAGGCSFSQLNGRAFSNWPRQRSAWNPGIRKNPHFQGKENGVSRFDFGGAESFLRFSTDTDQECDGECMAYGQLELKLPNGQTMIVSENRRNSISENLLLVGDVVRLPDNSWRASVDLFDMRNGENVLEPMQLATWID